METDVALIAADLNHRAGAMAAGAKMDAADARSPIRDLVVRQLLKVAGELINSCSALAQGPHEQALNVLIRSLIEIGIKIHWATISEANATHLDSATKEQIKKIFRANARTGIARIVDAEGADITKEFLASGRARKSQNQLSVEAMAIQSGLLDIYKLFYRFQSLHTHSSDLAPLPRTPG